MKLKFKPTIETKNNILKILSIFILNFYIFSSLSIRFFGSPFLKGRVINFSNEKNYKNKYSEYKKIAQDNLTENLHAILIIPGKKLDIIKIYKMPIGKDSLGNLIDSEGELYQFNEPNADSLIQVEGDYKKWAKYYPILKKANLLKEIYHVTLNKHSANIWMHPQVLVQIDNQINNLSEFYSKFPYLFKKGMLIDLRDTKRVGVSFYSGSNFK